MDRIRARIITMRSPNSNLLGTAVLLLLSLATRRIGAYTPLLLPQTRRIAHYHPQASSKGRLLLGCPRLQARRRFYNDEEDDDDYYDEYDEYVKRRRAAMDDLGDFRDRTGLDLPSSYGRRDGWRLPESVSKALLAGVFVLGIGLGVTVDSQVNTNPKDLASRDAIDNAAPNPTLCAKLGASAMAFDQRVFVSFNPFNVYVSQADVKPACVLREANIVPVLRARGLINDDEVRSCKENMNTWAFVGSLDDTPQLSCVYKSQDAQNEFLSNPKLGIGEDYLDDDREKFSTKKVVKGSLTEAQKQLVRNQEKAIPVL
jgi:Protein of unknown function (DUF3172)